MTQHLIELLRASRSPDGESVKMFSQVSFFSLSPQCVNFYLKFNSGTELINSPATAVAYSYIRSLCLGENLYFPFSVTACQDTDEEEEIIINNKANPVASCVFLFEWTALPGCQLFKLLSYLSSEMSHVIVMFLNVQCHNSLLMFSKQTNHSPIHNHRVCSLHYYKSAL